jgi:hypothetical protein
LQQYTGVRPQRVLFPGVKGSAVGPFAILKAGIDGDPPAGYPHVFRHAKRDRLRMRVKQQQKGIVMNDSTAFILFLNGIAVK